MKALLWIMLWIVVMLMIWVSFRAIVDADDDEDNWWLYPFGLLLANAAIVLYRHVANYIDQLPD